MKILIIKTSALGDIIHAFPVADYLKEKFPSAQIDWVVESPFLSLVDAHPAIHQAIPIDSKLWRNCLFSSKIRKEIRQSLKQFRQKSYDVIFDLQANIKSGLITACANGKVKVGFTSESVSEWPNILFTNHRITVPKGESVRFDYLYLVQNYFADPFHVVAPSPALELNFEEQTQLVDLKRDLREKNCSKKPLVMLCHGSNWKNKQVTLESLREFLQLLQPHLGCFFLFAWGNPQEKSEAEILQQYFNDSCLLEKVSLPVLQHLMGEMQWVIAMDSLPLHLAATTDVPTFSVFGASLATRYAPQGAQHHTFQGSCPYGRTFETRCPILRTCKTGACIRSVSGQTLFEAFLKCSDPHFSVGRSEHL